MGGSGRYDTSFKAPKFGPFRFFFARAENVSEINTNDHDGSIALSPTGKTISSFIVMAIFGKRLERNTLGKPKKMHQVLDARSSVERVYVFPLMELLCFCQ